MPCNGTLAEKPYSSFSLCRSACAFVAMESSLAMLSRSSFAHPRLSPAASCTRAACTKKFTSSSSCRSPFSHSFGHYERARASLGFSDPTKRGPSLLVKASASASDDTADPSPLAAAAPAAATPDESAASNEMGNTLYLGVLFGLWYLFNIYFNIYNKQVLKVYQFPVTVTQFQFLVGSLIAVAMWTVGLHKKPQLSKSQLLAVLPLALVHTMGNLFTNMSLGKVAVSFTHTIKAMEPFFSVILSALFLGEYPSLLVVASLVPIVGGVALASLTEASFNWAGFLSAMASNVTFQSRNVLSKKLMLKKEKSMDNINLFSIITIMSLFLLAPVTFLMEGVKFTPAYLQSAGLDVKVLAVRALLAAVCFHSYQQVSYMILQRVSPVTHSVGNCVKRVVVIVTSVLFFRTPVSLINGVGTGIALAGVFGYSRVKQTKKQPEKSQ